MSRLLVVHPARGALEHEALAVALAAHASSHELVLACGEPALAWLERELARADALVLVEPAPWWPRSLEERLRLPWLAWIERHVEFDRRNELGGVACLARAKPRSAALDHVHWLGGAGLAGLDAWLAGRSGAAPARALAFDDAGECIERPDAVAAIELALSRTREVALVGPAGSGKTCLLHAWVAAARAEGRCVAHHVVLPEHGATRRSAWILASLARQLDPDAHDLPAALARAERATGGAAIVLVLDGLERVDDVAGLLAAVPSGATRVRWLLACRPGARPESASVVALASAPALLDALVARVTRLDPDDLAALRERAGGSPAYVAAMIDEASSRIAKLELREMTVAAEGDVLPELPRRFASELACMLGHVAALPLVLRRRVERVLDALALLGGSAPLSILQSTLELGPLSELLATAAGTLVLEPAGVPRLALLHAGLTELLRAQLDDRTALEQRLRAGLERLAARGKLDTDEVAFVDTWLAGLRPSTELAGGLADVAQLQAMLVRGGSSALERALAPYEEGLGAVMREVVRRQQAALTRDAASLPGLLWNGLLQRGWATHQLLASLRWPDGGPRVRLEHPLDQADQRERTLPHPAEVHDCAIDSSGARVLSACDDGHLRVWSREDGSLLAELSCDRMIRACAISPDGRWAVAATTGGTLSRWDLVERRRTHTAETRDEWVRALAIDDAAMQVLAGDDGGRVWLWRVGDGVRELGSHDERVVSVAMRPDARLGVSVGGKQVYVWDLAAGHRVGSSPKHEYTLNAMALARTGKHAYVCGIGASWVLALPGCTITTTHAHKLPLANACAALEREDLLLVAHAGRHERWNMRSGELEARTWLHAADIESVAVSAGDRWRASAAGHDVVVSGREDESRSLATADPREAVATNPSGTHALVATRGLLELVELASGKLVTTLDTGRVNALAWIDDDRVLTAGASNHELAIWSVRKRAIVKKRALGGDWLRGVALAPDCKQALVVGDEKRTWLVDLDDLSERSLGRHPDWVHACAFAEGGELAVSVDGDAELRTWSRETGKLLCQVESEKNYSYAALACTGMLAFAGGSSGVIDVWNAEAGRLLGSVDAHAGKITALALADDARVLVSAGQDGRIGLWLAGTSPRLLEQVIGHAPFHGVCVAGSRIVATDESGNLWSLRIDWRRLVGS